MKQGFTLILALIIASIILVIGLGVADLVLREIQISGSGRDSLMAFFASDSGVECVLYWDLVNHAFATTSTSSTINCGDSSRTKNFDPSSGLTTFMVYYGNGTCASVTVDKNTFPLTTVSSYGRNTCNLSDPRRVERALRVTY